MLVAFFYGGEKRGNALPGAKAGPTAADPPAGLASANGVCIHRDGSRPESTRKAVPDHEAPRLLTIQDVLSLAA